MALKKIQQRDPRVYENTNLNTDYPVITQDR